MPQMMPMYWFMILLFITLIFIIMISNMMFFYLPFINKLSNNLNNLMKWNWKW